MYRIEKTVQSPEKLTVFTNYPLRGRGTRHCQLLSSWRSCVSFLWISHSPFTVIWGENLAVVLTLSWVGGWDCAIQEGNGLGNPGRTRKAKRDGSALSTTLLPGSKEDCPDASSLWEPAVASPTQQCAVALLCQPWWKHCQATHSSRAQISYLCSNRKGSGLGLRRIKLICQYKYRLCMQPRARSLICLSVHILWKGAVILP